MPPRDLRSGALEYAAGRQRASVRQHARQVARPALPGVSAEGVGAQAQVADIQRLRLFAGAVRAVAECGYEDATVAQITARARVSRRTFYELFDNREECFTALLDSTIEHVRVELVALDLAELEWRKRVRMGLWEILCFLDREPALARACVAHLSQGGSGARGRYESLAGRLAGVVNEGRTGRGERDVSSLVAEGVVGATFTILHTRLLRERQEPMRDLLGELTELVTLPYLGAAGARKERLRPGPPLRAAVDPQFPGRSWGDEDPLDGVAMRLTYRTARVLEVMAGRSGASNRELAEAAGIADQGQVSKLLARLQRLALVKNQSAGHLKGEPNAWALTSRGKRLVAHISFTASSEREVA